jgi:outer membrane lipoprotein SlyB
MGVTGFWGAVGFALGGFALADILAHPQGTQTAGNVVTTLWNATAQGVAGQKITA